MADCVNNLFGYLNNYCTFTSSKKRKMKIQVNSIEGKTSKKGAKQNKLYTVIDRRNNWYDAIDEKGSKFSIWDCNGDWSKIGIMRDGHTLRVSYTTEFKVIEA